MDDGNVFEFGAVQGGKEPSEDGADQLPQNDYTIITEDDLEFDATGFLIFTTHHLAIMQDAGNGKGAIPVLVFPFHRIKFAGLSELINMEVTDDEEV